MIVSSSTGSVSVCRPCRFSATPAGHQSLGSPGWPARSTGQTDASHAGPAAISSGVSGRRWCSAAGPRSHRSTGPPRPASSLRASAITSRRCLRRQFSAGGSMYTAIETCQAGTPPKASSQVLTVRMLLYRQRSALRPCSALKWASAASSATRHGSERARAWRLDRFNVHSLLPGDSSAIGRV